MTYRWWHGLFVGVVLGMAVMGLTGWCQYQDLPPWCQGLGARHEQRLTP